MATLDGKRGEKGNKTTHQNNMPVAQDDFTTLTTLSLSSAVLATKTTPQFVLAISFLSFFLYFMSLLLLDASVVISFPHFI